MLKRLRCLLQSPFWLPTGAALLAPLLLFADVLFTGRALIWGLPALQFVPWRYSAWLQLKAGILPLWNPLNGMGAPLVANDQLALYYPPGWLLYLLAGMGGAPALAWGSTLLVVLHLGWAGLGTARLLRDLGLGRLAQTIGALAFGLCGYFTARNGVFPIVWTGAWLPWVLWAANRLVVSLEGPRRVKWLPPAIAMGMLLLAGHAQTAWYTLLLAATWVLFWGWHNRGWKGMLKAAGWFSLAGLAAALLSAAQLVPTAEYLLQSQRSGSVNYDLAMTYSFWPWRLLAFFAPDFFGNPGAGNYWGYAAFWEDAAYIGLLPLITALSTLPQLWRRQTEPSRFQPLVRFLWGAAVVSLIFALGKNTPVFPFLYRYVPTFNMFQAPARFLILTEIALALLAAVGVEGWRKPTGKSLRWLKRGVVAAAALIVGAGAGWLVLRGVKTSFIGATALAGVWAVGTGLLALRMPPEGEAVRSRLWNGLVVVWAALDLLSAGWLLHPSAPANVYRENNAHSQVLRQELNGARVYLTQDDEYLMKFSRFLRFTDFRPIEEPEHIRQVLLPNTNLLDGFALTGNFDPLVPARYSEWMNFLEELSYEERIPWLRMMNVGLVEQYNPRVSLGVDYLPVKDPFRWYWATCPVTAEDEPDSLRQLQEKMTTWSGDGTPEWVVLENVSGSADCAEPGTAAIRLMEERPNRLVFQVNTDQAGWLVLNDTWYPGWKVDIDGQMEHTPVRANYLFRAATVPSGQHMVTFTYSPQIVYYSLLVSGISWIAVAVVTVRKLRSAK